jgi:hypothetical protein
MSKLRSFWGFMKVTASLMKEEWDTMDRKFYRLAVGAISFLAMGAFYFFFLRNITPF